MDDRALRIDHLAYPSFDAVATRRGHLLVSGFSTAPVPLLPGSSMIATFGVPGRVGITASADG
jgi:hypothetical protein